MKDLYEVAIEAMREHNRAVEAHLRMLVDAGVDLAKIRITRIHPTPPEGWDLSDGVLPTSVEFSTIVEVLP